MTLMGEGKYLEGTLMGGGNLEGRWERDDTYGRGEVLS